MVRVLANDVRPWSLSFAIT